MASDVSGVLAAIRIVERLRDEWPSGVRAGALARELNINRSTCYTILGTLERSGWLVPADDDHAWMLGPGLTRLAAIQGGHVMQTLQREMERLARDRQIVVFATSHRVDDRYLVVGKAESPRPIRITVDIGETFPFSAPVLMRVFAAWQPDSELRTIIRSKRIERFTNRTLVGQRLFGELKLVRGRGYAISLGEYDLAQSGVAASVFDGHGRPRWAICTLGFSTELHTGNIEQIGKAVREAAKRVTKRIGGNWPT
jgi:IclR family transcriptional regulator, acetate operon repressor